MSYKERRELFLKIEKMRNRPLITYVTSIRPNMKWQEIQSSLLFDKSN